MFGTEPYQHEHAYSPDGNLMYYIRSIHEDGIAPDVRTNNRGTLAWCSDAQFKTEDMESTIARVPVVYFQRHAGRVRAVWGDANYRDIHCVVRAAVGIDP